MLILINSSQPNTLLVAYIACVWFNLCKEKQRNDRNYAKIKRLYPSQDRHIMAEVKRKEQGEEGHI